jgi:hypothetical protein
MHYGNVVVHSRPVRMGTENLKMRRYLGDPDVNGMIKLKYVKNINGLKWR